MDKLIEFDWEGQISGQNYISIIDFIDLNSDKVRDKYNIFINNLAFKDFQKKSFKDHFNFHNGYNLWWMSLIFEKSLYKSSFHNDCLKLIAIELILKKKSLEK